MEARAGFLHMDGKSLGTGIKMQDKNHHSELSSFLNVLCESYLNYWKLDIYIYNSI
jgi:hypothetical protein